MRRPKVLAIGSSTGGPQALATVLKDFGTGLSMPIVITQHMPPKFTTILAKHLSSASGLPCREAADGDRLVPNEILLAPGDYHMEIVADGNVQKVSLNQNPAENFVRPAVDPMFRSLIKVFDGRVLGVILTGMGSDGLKGSEDLVAAGGQIIAQDEKTSTVWGMPGAVATKGLCAAVVPLDAVATTIKDFCARGLP